MLGRRLPAFQVQGLTSQGIAEQTGFLSGCRVLGFRGLRFRALGFRGLGCRGLGCRV